MGRRRVDPSIAPKHDRIRDAASGAVHRRNFHVLVNAFLARSACGFTSGLDKSSLAGCPQLCSKEHTSGSIEV